MIDSSTLARKAYFALLEDVAKCQAKLLELEALKARFGDRALMPDTLMHSIGGMRDAPGNLDRSMKFFTARLEEYYEILDAMEDVFAAKQDADMAAFADYIRSKYGKGN